MLVNYPCIFVHRESGLVQIVLNGFTAVKNTLTACPSWGFPLGINPDWMEYNSRAFPIVVEVLGEDIPRQYTVLQCGI